MKYYFKCPNCKNNEQFTTPSESSSGLGCLLLFFGGIIPALLYADSTNRRIQCANCGHIFQQPPLPNSSVSKLAKWIVLILVLFIFGSFLILVEPEISSLLPRYQWLSGFEGIIRANPYETAFCITALVLVLAIITILSSMISNARFRASFRKEYLTQPIPYHKAKQENANQRVDPTVKTTVESENEQGTAGQL